MTAGTPAGTMQALRWDGPGAVHAVEVARPTPAEGWTVVDVAYTGLCGTDLHICSGHHPRAAPGLVLGHELSGTLAEAAGDPPRSPVNAPAQGVRA